MLFALFGVFVLACVGCVAFVSNVFDETSSVSTGSASTAPAGSEVEDGKFAFQITQVDPPSTTVGDNAYTQQSAQGQFIVVHVNVANIGGEPQSYFGENQTLIDASGREFTNSTGAELAANDNSTLSEINPGNKVTTAIVFDVPPGTAPAAVEFHDSMFSGGTRVALN
ncbi:hypothetical protein GCM10023318_25760 [Nocardia callitridis]|uniref:DUF4352 domain-containing protein n=1 Tax=Nocardia callitridis TaxID=648753 RepID=A0ABP9KAQ3_9NOCA